MRSLDRIYWRIRFPISAEEFAGSKGLVLAPCDTKLSARLLKSTFIVQIVIPNWWAFLGAVLWVICQHLDPLLAIPFGGVLFDRWKSFIHCLGAYIFHRTNNFVISWHWCLIPINLFSLIRLIVYIVLPWSTNFEDEHSSIVITNKRSNAKRLSYFLYNLSKAKYAWNNLKYKHMLNNKPRVVST